MVGSEDTDWHLYDSDQIDEADFDSLVALADTMQNEIDAERRRLAVIRTFMSAALLVLVVFIATIGLSTGYSVRSFFNFSDTIASFLEALIIPAIYGVILTLGAIINLEDVIYRLRISRRRLSSALIAASSYQIV